MNQLSSKIFILSRASKLGNSKCLDSRGWVGETSKKQARISLGEKIRIIQSWRNVDSSSFAPFTFQAPGQGQVHQEGGQEPRSQLSPPDDRQHSNTTFHERHYTTSGRPLARQSNTGTRSIFFPASPVASSCLKQT